jgi:hypothetical protein
MFLDSIGGVMELNALPKDDILNWSLAGTRDSIIPKGGLLYQLGIFAFAITAIMIVITLLLAIRYTLKNKDYPKIKPMIEKSIRKVVWNMVIKTFQGGFLGYSVSALMSVCYSLKPLDIAISVVLLIGLVVLMIVNGVYLWKKPATQLARKYVRSRVGATYSELNIYSKVALLQSTLFYVYRFVAALLLVGLVPFCVQLHGLVVMTVSELCYLHCVKPYIL